MFLFTMQKYILLINIIPINMKYLLTYWTVY